MDSIFHEQQEGALCAQHCLNSLLQGQYYTAVDLADIARQLDDEERRHRCNECRACSFASLASTIWVSVTQSQQIVGLMG